MEQQISQAFLTVLGLDNAARQQAELYLQNIARSPGFLKALMSLAANSTVTEVRLSSAVHLKNSLSNWLLFAEEERAYVKSCIIPNLRLSTPDKVRSQIAEIAKRLWELEKPWESAMEEVGQALVSTDPDVLYGGLSMLLQIILCYEFSSKPHLRAELHHVTGQCFPVLLELLKKLLSSLTEASFQYIAVIINTLWCALYIDLTPEFLDPAVYLAWSSLLSTVLKIDLGRLEEPQEHEVRGAQEYCHPAWQSKRWSMQLLHRLFQRYDNFLSPKYGSVARVFYEGVSAEVVVTALEEAWKFSSKHQPSLYKAYLIKFLTQALNYPPTLELIRPKVGELVTSVILPLISRVPKDEEQWNQDAIEFIRKENDLMRSYFSPKCSAIDFMIKLCEKGYLDAILVYLASQLQTAGDLVVKEALLLAIGSLEMCIAKRPDLIASVEPLLVAYAMPDLTSPIGFARMRAVWMYSQFAKFPLKDSQAKAQVCTLICNLMLDEALPVQIEAATAIPKLVQWSEMDSIIKPELRTLIEAYLKLMDKIDSEDLVESLEEIVGTYNMEITPFAVELTSSLTEHFFRMASEGSKANNGESEMAAASALTTINKIIDAFDTDSAQLKRIAAVVYPVLEYSLDEVGCEFYEEALHILTYLLYYSEAGSLPELSSLYPLLIKSVMGDGETEPYAHEQFDQFFAPVANFIAKYPAQLISQVPASLSLASYLLSHSLTDLACKVWLCLLENMKDSILPFIPAVLQTVLSYESSSKIDGAILLLVVCEALWFFPSATAEALGLGLASVAEKLLHVKVNLLQEFYLLKVLVLGVTALLEHAMVDESFTNRLLVQLIKLVLKLDDLKRDDSYMRADFPHEDSPQAEPDEQDMSLSIEEDLYDSQVEMLDELSLLKHLLTVKPSLSPRLRTLVPEEELNLLARLLTS
jgi:hypothetical protein